jgi:hypothetical protein
VNVARQGVGSLCGERKVKNATEQFDSEGEICEEVAE